MSSIRPNEIEPDGLLPEHLRKPLSVRDVHEASLLQMIEDRDLEIASLQSQLAEARERERLIREAVKEWGEGCAGSLLSATDRDLIRAIVELFPPEATR